MIMTMCCYQLKRTAISIDIISLTKTDLEVIQYYNNKKIYTRIKSVRHKQHILLYITMFINKQFHIMVL